MVGILAARTGVDCVAGFRAGRRYDRIAVAVSQSGGRRIFVAVAASTSMYGIASVKACRGNHSAGRIAVRVLLVTVSAACAGEYINFVLDVVVPQCLNLGIAIAVTAGAFVEGIAGFRTGRSNNGIGVAVLVHIAAARADVVAVAVAQVIMPQSLNFGVGIAITAFAFVQGIACLGTGRGDDRVGIGVVGGHLIDRLGDVLFNPQSVGIVGKFKRNVLLRRAAFGCFQTAPLCPREVPRRAVVVPDGVLFPPAHSFHSLL